MKQIKRKTYYNLMRIVRMIEAKGYDFDTSVNLAHKVFDNYEANPGISVLSFVDRIIPADEYIQLYR